MPPVGFEPTISAGERPQTYALDRAATGTGISIWKQTVVSETGIAFSYRGFRKQQILKTFPSTET